jgi:hypothetical protein
VVYANITLDDGSVSFVHAVRRGYRPELQNRDLM